MTEQEFDCHVGELMKYAQCIEHDVKWIYAYMLEGDNDTNFDALNKKTLGTVVHLLKKLDQSDDDPWFDEADYALLKDITAIRNFWAHQGYIKYVYGGDRIASLFDKTSGRLFNDCTRLKKLQKSIEKTRLEFYT